MSDRFFLLLNRDELAEASYFPASELKTTPDVDWLEAQLLPAVRQLCKRRTKIIREMPLTFWVGVRSTARFERGEIFVHVTPMRLRVDVERAVRQTLHSIADSERKVFGGSEYVPDAWLPYCQVFRGKLLRFFGDFNDAFPGASWRLGIRWMNEGPRPFLQWVTPELANNPDSNGELWVRADLTNSMSAADYRRWQQGLSGVAHREEMA